MYSNVARFVASVGIRSRGHARDKGLQHSADSLRLSSLTEHAVASVWGTGLTLHVLAFSLGPKRVPHRTVYEKISRTPHRTKRPWTYHPRIGVRDALTEALAERA